MSPSEHEIQDQILEVIGGREDVRLFRNNVGKATDGRHVVRFGLVKGASDLIGWLIPSGRFLAIEVKSARGRVSPEQRTFLAQVQQGGGVAVVARSLEDAVTAVEHAQKVSTP